MSPSLLLAAPPLFFRKDLAETAPHPPGPVAASLAGSGIGLVSGLTGVGGGVLITPILLYCRWATGKRAAAISAVFILLNSIAALAGHQRHAQPSTRVAPVRFVRACWWCHWFPHGKRSSFKPRHLSDSGRNPAARRAEALFYLKGLEENPIGLLDTFGPRQIACKSCRIETLKRRFTQNDSKNHIRRTNWRRSSRIGFCDRNRPGTRRICSQGP